MFLLVCVTFSFCLISFLIGSHRGKKKITQDPALEEFLAWKSLGGKLTDYGPHQQGTYQRIKCRWDELEKENKALRIRDTLPTRHEPTYYIEWA